MFRRVPLPAVVVALTLVSGATPVLPATAATHGAAGIHRLTVVVKKNLAPAAEKKLAVLVLVSQDGVAPAGAVATPGRPLTVHLASSGLYRVKVEIDASCRGSCSSTYRISGSGNHKLEIVPACRPSGAGFVCSKIKIVKVY